jgi:predicted component of type VI protein secretion system
VVISDLPAQVFRAPPGTIDLDLSAAASARLVVLTEPWIGTEFLLDGDCFFIGRTLENDIVLNHGSVSRQHAKVARDGDRYLISDLDSANGVLVNGVRLTAAVELRPRDFVTLGRVCLRFIAVGEPPVAEAPPASRPVRPTRGVLVLAGALGVAAAVGVTLLGIRPRPRAPVRVAPIGAAPAIEDFTHILDRRRDPPAESWVLPAPEPSTSGTLTPERRRRPSIGPWRRKRAPSGEAPPSAPVEVKPPSAPARGSSRTIDTDDPYAQGEGGQRR